MVICVEVDRVVLEVKDEPLLRTKDKGSLMAQGLHQESRIKLYCLRFESQRQASVFIYTACYILDPRRIVEIDSRFSDIDLLRVSREFKDTSLEDLRRRFLDDVKPLIPFMDHDYSFNRLRIFQHSFVDKSVDYLEGVIRDLRV